jgi:mono/diheme cytochrome c family protein
MIKIQIAQSIGLAASCILALAGCETNPNPAFPTAQALSAPIGSGEKADLATLDLGRKIYTTSCTECHVARPIAQHSVAQWKHYVDIMAPRARLQPNERAAVEAYVIAARESLPADSGVSSL